MEYVIFSFFLLLCTGLFRFILCDKQKEKNKMKIRQNISYKKAQLRLLLVLFSGQNSVVATVKVAVIMDTCKISQLFIA